MMSGLLLGMVLSALLDSIAWLPFLLDLFLLIWYMLICVFCPIFTSVCLHMLKCSWAHTLSCVYVLLTYSAFAVCFCVQYFCYMVFYL
jgi:hypothetical protein